MHMILKSDLKMQRHLQDTFHIYYWKMIANITKLVTIVNFSTSLLRSNSNDVHRRVRPIAGKMSAQTSLLDISP